MKQRITIALVGIGGYGNSYVSELLDAPNKEAFQIVGAVDPSPQSCNRLGELKARGVPIHSSIDSFFANGRADLVIISSPLQLHASQTCMALGHGSHVLCEKPLCATPEDANRMLAAQRKSSRQVAVGYQWSFSRAIQELKKDILNGVLGKPIRFRTLVLWPRTERYYHRNNWAGAKQAKDGTWILDSPVNNACAHFLHNMFYVLGDSIDESARPARVTAELYRAYPIQNFDTAAIRCTTANDVELMFITSHALSLRMGPCFVYEFEKAVVSFKDGFPEITAKFPDGSAKSYGSPDGDRMRKLWSTIDSIENRGEAICGIAAAASQTRCNWAAQLSTPEINVFAEQSIHAEGAAGDRQVIVEGLAEDLIACHERGKLPNEMEFSWAHPGKPITIENESTGMETYRSEG